MLAIMHVWGLIVLGPHTVRNVLLPLSLSLLTPAHPPTLRGRPVQGNICSATRKASGKGHQIPLRLPRPPGQ